MNISCINNNERSLCISVYNSDTDLKNQYSHIKLKDAKKLSVEHSFSGKFKVIKSIFCLIHDHFHRILSVLCDANLEGFFQSFLSALYKWNIADIVAFQRFFSNLFEEIEVGQKSSSDSRQMSDEPL